MTVVSASGGVGKSAIALMAGWLCARAGVQTLLLEGDLQFGDMGFWLGLDDELPDLGLGAQAAPVEVREGLGLYKAPAFPEVAEEVAEEVVRLVPKLRASSELVIADTGQFWSGLTAELVRASDIVVVVADARPASVVGAVKARELLERVGVPATRCVCAYNRWSSRLKLTAADVAAGVGVQDVLCIPDGRAEVDALLSLGEVDELACVGNAFVRGVDALLSEVLPKMGVLYAGAAPRRRRGLFA